MLKEIISDVLGSKAVSIVAALDEVTVEVAARDWLEVGRMLRDHPKARFDTLIDLCGVDFSAYGNGEREGPKYAVVVHLLSVALNQRLRVRCFAADDDFPVLPTLVEVWPSANWFEREAFDLFGIVFEGHPDLRRILTDYGFVGHPFRKDFPVSGYVEMRYDPEQRRVLYQPVTIEPRENVPRIVRDDSYAH
ncbi:MAG: NADH-quinone oxidoreductase subunit C [Burkholderiales bacterium]|nr:NADH-quinone oxidoreductase subunit C [Pseudomonadota bacterium]MCC7068033.1 NADH-quinone oxidoreductase subunit C [Burkholderiales bacterium]